LDRLRETAKYDEVARRHARWLARIAEEIEATYSYVPVELLPELDNVRVAIAWSLGAQCEDDRVYGAQILTGLSSLWDRVGRSGEHRRLIEAALERIDERRHPLAVSDLLRNRIVRAWDEANVLELIDRGLEVSEKSGDPLAPVKLIADTARVLIFRGLLEEAETCIERASALSIANGIQDSMLYASLLFGTSELRMRQGRIDDARSAIEGAERIAFAHGHRSFLVCYTYFERADIEYAAGNKQLALEYVERMMESEFADDAHVGIYALRRATSLRLQLGDEESALESLCVCLKSGVEDPSYSDLEHAALALALRRNPIAAARVYGFVHALDQRAPFSRSAMRQGAHTMLLSSLRQQLDDEAIASACRDGAWLSADEAVAEALVALGCSVD
jgi:tetratricopeptide (TPR) repeat protein